MTTETARWLLVWLAESSGRALVMGLIVLATLAVLRPRSIGARKTMLRMALCGALLMPVLTIVAPAIRVPIGSMEMAPLRGTVIALPLVAVPPALPVKPAISVDVVLLAAYALIAAGLMSRFAVGYWLAARIRQRAWPVDSDVAVDQVEVVEAAECRVPFTFGWLDPVIVLPATWRDWPVSSLRAVLTHEIAHVSERDFLFQVLSAAHRCLFWFSPLSWWLDRRLSEVSEESSDAAVLAAEYDRVAYAQLLFQFLEGRSRGRLVVAMSMVRGGSATRRIERILHARDSAVRLTRRAGVGLAAAFVPLVWVCAGCSAVAQPQAPAAPKAPVAVQSPAAPQSTPQAPVAPRAPVAPKRTEGFLFRSNRYSDNGYVIVTGDDVSMSGTTYDADRARSLRDKIQGDFIWFRRNGNNYVIRDSAAVRRAISLFDPQRQLGERQAELGQRQAELGQRQAQLGEMQARVSVEVKLDDLVRELQKLQGRLTQADLGRLQSQLAEAQALAGGEQAKLGQQQAVLGGQQAELGAQQARLGAEQARLAEQASKEMQRLIDEAIASGRAQPEP